MTKECSKCKQEKPLTEFHSGKRYKDGKFCWCKECCSIYRRARHSGDSTEVCESHVKQRKSDHGRLKYLLAMGLKECAECKETKKIGEFNNRKDSKQGKRAECKSCVSKKARAWREENHEKHLERLRDWRKANVEQDRESSRTWYRENKEKGKAARKLWRQNNAEKHRANAKRWQELNRDRINEVRRKRSKEDIQFALAKKIRARIGVALKKSGKGERKAETVINLLGCSYSDFKIHIERQFTKGMTWERVMSGEIHLDHIRPISSFDLSDRDQQEEAFNFLNVRPMWASENLRKSDKITHLI